MRHTREEVAVARSAKSSSNKYDERGENKRTFHTDERSDNGAEQVRDAETFPREKGQQLVEKFNIY